MACAHAWKTKKLFNYAISRKICLCLMKNSFLAILLAMLISRKPVQRRGIGEKCGFFATRRPLKLPLCFKLAFFLIKKSNLAISTQNRFVMWKRRTSNVYLMLIAISLFRWLRYQLNRIILKAKWRSLWRHIWRRHILANLNNSKIISQIPSCSNLL